MTQPAASVSHVVWDWNGTLLDDLECCVQTANRLLDEFGLPRLDGIVGYRAALRFPIVDYYADLGFDTSPGGNFVEAAHRYMELYHEAAPQCGLHVGASETLAALHASGLRQVVISASEQSNLRRQMAPFALDRWVDDARGLDDIYAHSKEAIVHGWITDEGIPPSAVVMVGDSEHDAEIADAVGAHCVLFSGGHHSPERLSRHGVRVVDALSELPRLLARLMS